jgi:hypothetical protein
MRHPKRCVWVARRNWTALLCLYIQSSHGCLFALVAKDSLRGGSLLLSMTQSFWVERGPGVLLSGRMESAEIGPSAIKTKSCREVKSDCTVCVLSTFHFCWVIGKWLYKHTNLKLVYEITVLNHFIASVCTDVLITKVTISPGRCINLNIPHLTRV